MHSVFGVLNCAHVTFIGYFIIAASIIDSHLTNIINNDLSNNAFSDSAKLASVRPIYKKDDRNEIKNYRPVSILNCFSKIYEKF